MLLGHHSHRSYHIVPENGHHRHPFLSRNHILARIKSFFFASRQLQPGFGQEEPPLRTRMLTTDASRAPHSATSKGRTRTTRSSWVIFKCPVIISNDYMSYLRLLTKRAPCSPLNSCAQCLPSTRRNTVIASIRGHPQRPHIWRTLSLK